MVRDETADHEVDRHGWREIQNVHHAIANFVDIVGDRLRNADGLAVEVEPDEPDRQAAFARPAPDRPQQIAVAAADIDEGHLPSVRPWWRGATTRSPACAQALP